MEENNFFDVCKKKGIHVYTGIVIDMCSTDIGLINVGDFIEYCELNDIKTVFMQYEFRDIEPIDITDIEDELTEFYSKRFSSYPYSEEWLPQHITREFFNPALSKTIDEIEQDRSLYVNEEENEDEPILIRVWASSQSGCRIYTVLYEEEEDEQEEFLSKKAVFNKYANRIAERLSNLLQEAKKESARIDKEIKESILAEISEAIENNSDLITMNTQKARNEYADRIQIRYQEERGCNWLTKKQVRSMVEFSYVKTTE